MRVKKLIMIVLVLCTVATGSGCWDSMDINKKELLTLVITDKQKDEYVFYVSMPNLEKGNGQFGGGTGGGEFDSVSGRGSTLSAARRDLDSKMDNIAFLGTVRALLLTGNMIQEDFSLYMSRLDAMEDYRKALQIAVTFEKPEDILSSHPENNVSIGESISDMLTSLQHSGSIVSYSLSDIYNFRYLRMCFVLPNIGLEDGQIAMTGYSIIHNNRYLDTIALEDSAGLLFLLGDKAVWNYAVIYDGVLIAIKVELKGRKVKTHYSNGQVTFDLSFKFESNILYRSSIVPLDDNATELIRQDLVRQIMEDLSEAVAYSKSVKCDYLGFKNKLRINYPNDAQTIDWSSAYVNSVINISLETTLEPKGMMDFEAGSENVN